MHDTNRWLYMTTAFSTGNKNFWAIYIANWC